jgi:hypothetical protein
VTKHLEGYAGRKVLGGYCRVAPDGVAVQWWCDQAAYSGVGVPDTFTEGLRVERERFIELAALELQGE